MKKITETDFIEAAKLLGTDVPTVKSVWEVESNGSGFLGDGQVKILFEGHKFWEQLAKRKIDPSKHLRGNEDILYKNWTKKYYKGGILEHTRLQRAVTINRDAALSSASYGAFQIMGFNFLAAGFKTLQDFVNAMMKDEGEHLKAFINFCINTRFEGKSLAYYLQNKMWAKFAEPYNGPSFRVNKYDVKLSAAYRKYSE